MNTKLVIESQILFTQNFYIKNIHLYIHSKT